MRTFLLVALAALCCYSTLATPQKSTTLTCTTAQNPWGASRCTNANCVPYVDSAATTVPLGGFACNTAVTGYTIFGALAAQDTTGKTSDSVCSNNCAAAATGDTTPPCDSTGTLCSTCGTSHSASGKTPSATSQQPCDCIIASDKTVTCPACAHGYYGADSSNAAVTPSAVNGATDSTYTLAYTGATLPSKCVACPTLSNCAQCASATVCAKCTTASGNTPTSSGSCSASKILASVAFVFAGLVALLF